MTSADNVEVPDSGASQPMSYEQFGVNFIRLVLHEQRVLTSVNRVLGERIRLGPIGAGPGRVFAKISAVGTFEETYGEQVESDLLVYRVFLPVAVDFEVDLAVDTHHFHADVLLPLTLTVRVEEPLTIVWDIAIPDERDVTIRLVTDKRRSALLQRVAGLDDELRRFLVRVVGRELEKPHVKKATHIDMGALIDGAWPVIADQFLPPEPAPAPT